MAERVYRSVYIFTAVKIDDEFCSKTRRKGAVDLIAGIGPIFPIFLNADFTSYGGFRQCVEELGLQGFQYLDRDKEFSLGEQLGGLIAGKRKLLAHHYMIQVYERIKTQLIQDQNMVRRFYLWFYEKEEPLASATLLGNSLQRPISLIYQLFYADPAIKKEWNLEFPAGLEEILEFKQFDDVWGAYHKFINEHVKLAPALPFEEWGFGQKHGIRPRPSGREFVPLIKTWGGVTYKHVHASIPARCYMEIQHLIEDEKQVCACDYCGGLFVPSKRGERFCSWGEGKPCKKYGPQDTFYKNMSEEELLCFREKKRYQAKLKYLEKIGRTDEHDKLKEEFLLWKKATEKPRRRANYGKVTRKG